MGIAGLQKLTLLDYPGKVACTVFLSGCNFRCPFCHNSGLLSATGMEEIAREEFLAFLDSRKGLLDAVCVSGGEPTLTPQLADLLQEIKRRGFLVKLDTNGSRPQVLKEMVDRHLVDFVAMDVKNSPDAYDKTAGTAVDKAALEESLRYLISGYVDYELRTTVVAQFHDEAAIRQMGQWLCSLVPEKKPKKIFLQHFVASDAVLQSGLNCPESQQMQQLLQLLTPFAERVELRG